MKKIINEPTQVVDEMLQGLSFMHDDLVERLDGFDAVSYTHLTLPTNREV